MKIVISALMIFTTLSSFAALEFESRVCGQLGYIAGNYVLMADHGDDYVVSAKSLDKKSMRKTTDMRIIVENHDYMTSDFPQACFEDVSAKRVSGNKLEVYEVSNVDSRDFL